MAGHPANEPAERCGLCITVLGDFADGLVSSVPSWDDALASMYMSAKPHHRVLVVPLAMAVTIFSTCTIASGYPRTTILSLGSRGDALRA